MKGGAGSYKCGPALHTDMQEQRRYTFTKSTGEYEAGQTYSLGRALGRRYVREGYAKRAEAPAKKKVTKKVVKERAASDPARETATGDE